MTIVHRPVGWGHIIHHESLIGGELVLTTDQMLYRGPILRIDNGHSTISIGLAWAACCKPNHDPRKWTMVTVCKYDVEKKNRPMTLQTGNIVITPNKFISFTLRLKTDPMKLQPDDVFGLGPRWKRLWALYPNLTFRNEVARNLFMYRGSKILQQILYDATAETTLAQIVASLGDNDLRERFMSQYIKETFKDRDIVFPKSY